MPKKSLQTKPTLARNHCGHDIPSGATYCKNCGRYQDWRWIFQAPAPLLAFLVSIVSIAGLSGQKIYEKIFPPKAELFISASSPDDFSSVTLHVVNNGGADALIPRMLDCVSKDQESHINYQSDAVTLVPAKGSLAVKFDSISIWVNALKSSLADSDALSLGEATTFFDEISIDTSYVCNLEIKEILQAEFDIIFTENHLRIAAEVERKPPRILANFSSTFD